MLFGYLSKKRGFGLIETLVGVALLLIVFLGVFGMIQLGIKLIAQSRNKITATALANQQLEIARNLSYDKIGTVGGIPAGSIPETETIMRNKIVYTVKTTVFYIDDPFDNLSPSDPLPTDYKRVKVLVLWSGFFGGQVFLQTDVAPKGIETTGGGGIVSILVFDANGQPVPQADVRVENSGVIPPIDATYQTNSQGRLYIPGAPACDVCYKITATKTDYSTERTYGTGESVRGVILATPNKPFLSVLENQLSEISFAIDRLSDKMIETIKYTEERTWNDSFDDQSKISGISQLVASSTAGSIYLDKQNGQYFLSGFLLSAIITPTSLLEWGRLNWIDETSMFTNIYYQILYNNGEAWVLIPDIDLTVSGVKNSEGFFDAPLDLSDLDPLKYKSIKLKANFSTADVNLTPVLFDWQLTWFSSNTSIPVPSVAFLMQGAKTLGLDSNSQPVYKYQKNLSTNSSGLLTISDLEWDSYRITVNGQIVGYDIANSSPPQPVNINPGNNQTVILKLSSHQINTLLATVRDSGGQPLPGVNVRLYKTGYDKTKITTDSGQVFFSTLTASLYNLKVEMSGYQDWSGEVDISGQTEQAIIMLPP